MKSDKSRDLDNSQKMLQGKPETQLQTSSLEKGRGPARKRQELKQNYRVAARKLKLKKITSIFEPVPLGERQTTNRENNLITFGKSHTI